MKWRKQITKSAGSMLSLVGFVILWTFIVPDQVVGAPGDIVNCSIPFNISDSEGYSSVDPFLLADPAGVIHLFWAEQLTGEPGPGGQADSIMYAVWDGNVWSEPIDIQLSPGDYFNRQIAGIQGVMDDQGIIHLIWMGPDNTFFYSSARADEAGNASAWQIPLELADDQTGAQFSIAIAYEPPQSLHIIYGRSSEGQARSVTYIRSENKGENWSEPVDIYIITDPERGASNTRLHVDNAHKIYATWTEWDDSGNGQTIFFANSLDSGNTWNYPVILAERTGDEYERDWTNLAVLGENQLVVLWEGGWRAYPQTQYSYDGGVTWSEPIDTFYWLIADNGFGEFVRDSTGRLHVFLMRRIREGYTCRFPGCEGLTSNETNTIWHSIWEGGTRWRDPLPVSSRFKEVDGGFTRAAVNNGNQVVLAWFSYGYREMMVMNCEIEAVLATTPQPWPSVTPEPTSTPVPFFLPTIAPTKIFSRSLSHDFALDDPNTLSSSDNSSTNPGAGLLIGVFPSVLMVVAVILFQRFRNAGH